MREHDDKNFTYKDKIIKNQFSELNLAMKLARIVTNILLFFSKKNDLVLLMHTATTNKKKKK